MMIPRKGSTPHTRITKMKGLNICVFRFTIAGSPVLQSICMNPIQNDQALLSVAHLRYSDDNNDYDYHRCRGMLCRCGNDDDDADKKKAPIKFCIFINRSSVAHDDPPRRFNTQPDLRKIMKRAEYLHFLIFTHRSSVAHLRSSVHFFSSFAHPPILHLYLRWSANTRLFFF